MPMDPDTVPVEHPLTIGKPVRHCPVRTSAIHGVWLYARETYHIGASGLTFGMLFFIFAIGALRWDRRAIALSMLVFFLYGGMIWGIFPGRPGISFEYHFFGAAIGVLGAIALRNLDPAPPKKKYSWEFEGDDDENPYGIEDEPSSDDEQSGGSSGRE
jgi:hypothetical protein